MPVSGRVLGGIAVGLAVVLVGGCASEVSEEPAQQETKPEPVAPPEEKKTSGGGFGEFMRSFFGN